MRSLLIKDCFLIIKQLKVFLIMIVLMAAYPSVFTNGFAVIYAVMLPVTALSYDDQSRWERMAAVMPYRTDQIVLSKYILGIGGAVVMYAVNIISSICISLVKGGFPQAVWNQVMIITMMLVMAFFVLAINMPMLFKLGSEKGRMLNMIVTVALACVVIALVNKMGVFSLPISAPALTAVMIGAAVIVLLLSVRASISIYRKKNYA